MKEKEMKLLLCFTIICAAESLYVLNAYSISRESRSTFLSHETDGTGLSMQRSLKRSGKLARNGKVVFIYCCL